MKSINSIFVTVIAACMSTAAEEISLESAPPVVVRTAPIAGVDNVDPTSTTEIRVTFSKTMQDGSWSWSTWGEENFPETPGKPRYLDDKRTCVLPVKLEPGRFYAIWLNSQKFKNFKDANSQPAVPYLLTFSTAGKPTASNSKKPVPPKAKTEADTDVAPVSLPNDKLLNDNQRLILAWTDRQFRGFLDARDFKTWPDKERTDFEARSIDALKGPKSREYYQAINTFGTLHSTQALPRLREIAYDRQDKDNRDRWMAIRAIGMTGEKIDVPELIHLVYHGNANTRWWAQISLVRLTGQNFGSDWKAWGSWWNAENGQPPFKPEIIRWWARQAENDKLAESLAEQDRKFLESVKTKLATN